MGHRKRLLSMLAGVVLVGALPSIAMANTTEAIAQSGGMTLTLVGVPLNLGITLDEFGKIDTVSIDSTVSPDHASDHKVTFERVGDGSTVVKVKAEGQKLTAKIKTSNIDQFVGLQTWSADVFGTADVDGTDAITSVDFNIIKVGEGDSAYLKIDRPPVVTPGAGIDFEVSGPTTDSDDDGDHDDEWEYESKAYVTFTMNGFTKTLKIEVETEYEDDDDHEGVRAKLKIELRGKDVQNLVGEAAVGERTWTGLLCDGTTASVTYTVDELGNVTVGPISAAGYTWDVDSEDDGFEVQFDSIADGEDDGAYVKVEVEDEDGTFELKVKSKTSASCGDDDDEDHDDDDNKKKDHDDDEDDDDDDHDKDDDDEKKGDDRKDDDDDDDDDDD